jgi:hypothetical protein
MDRETMINTLQEMRDALVRERDIPRQLPRALIPGHQHKASCHGPAGEMVCESYPKVVGTPSASGYLGRQADKSQALAIVWTVLDDWIRGGRENHEALGHRDENRGEECWRSFTPGDIRNMINDAARELGLLEFPLPETGQAEEDKR